MSSEDWERYKATILHLYLVEKETLYNVARYMQQEHQFAKKKSQYEYQFKKWGVKKNVKKKDWEHLRQQLERRAGKKSEITLFGVPLSPARVRKETQRYTSIPTASEFGKIVASPETPNKLIIRAQTPIIVDDIIWPSLPWFEFKNSVLPRLRNPSSLLRTFFTAIGSEQFVFRYEEKNPLKSLYEISRSPVDLRKAIFHLTNTIPDDCVNGQQGSDALAKDSSLLIATEALKLIFFHLSNKTLPFQEDQLHAHDRLALHLVEAVMRTNPELLSQLLSGHCVTTNAVKEALYGSAVRERHYIILSHLLDSGVDPDLPLAIPRTMGTIKHKTLRIYWGDDSFIWSGLEKAAYTRDTRLGRMLLHAGAGGNSSNSIVEMVYYRDFRNDKSATEFTQLLVDHGLLNDYSSPPSSCHDPRSSHFTELGIGYTRLNAAIMWEDKETTKRLLLPVVSHPPQVSMRVIQEALLISCLVGDVDTASTLLALHPGIVKGMAWAGITPLAATAWNTENTTIAESLLRLGADIGPTCNDGSSEISIPAPIHVAAYYGNTGLIQQLLARGADCNVRYKGRYRHVLELPAGVESPLQLALANDDSLPTISYCRAETVNLLLPHSSLLTSELLQLVHFTNDFLVPELISKGSNVTWVCRPGPDALEAAIVARNKAIISSYFASGGDYSSKALWVATKTAIGISEDDSIVRQVVSHRPTREIDDFEVKSLVYSINSRAWDRAFLLLQDRFILSPGRSWESFPRPLSTALLSGNQLLIEALTKRGYVLQGGDIPRLMEEAQEPILQAFLSQFPVETMGLWCRRAFLLCAVDSGNLQKVGEYIKLVDCLDFPSDLSEPVYDYCSHSPLHLAASNGNTEIARLLLDAGADLNFLVVWNGEKRTALQNAAEREKLHMVRLLLDRGARVNPVAQLRQGATALQYSAINGHLHIARLLISHGADIDAPPAKWYGRTALEGASENGRLDMLQFLLEMGARIDGRMRIHFVRSVGFAKKEGHHALANYLMQYGSWGDRDKMLCDKALNLDYEASFRYEDVDNWRFGRLKYRGHGDYYSVGTSDSSFSSSSKEVDDSDDGNEEDVLNEYDGNDDKSYDISYDEDSIRAWWDNVDLAILAGPSSPSSPSSTSDAGNQVIAQGPAPSQILTTERIVEVDDVAEDANIAQVDVSYNEASRALIDDRATNEQELWEQSHGLREGISVLSMSSCAPAMNFADGQGMALNRAETGVEGPFFGVDEAEAVGYANDQLEIWTQGGVVGEEGFDFGSNDYAPGDYPMDEQSTTLNVADAEWEGPFSGFDGFDDTFGAFYDC